MVKQGQSENSQWIVVCDNTALTQENATFFSLPHPGTRKMTKFLISGTDVYELKHYQPTFGSYFVNNSVQKDGKMYLSTRIDPIFLLMPLLSKLLMEKNVFVTLDQILNDTECKGYRHLNNCSFKELPLVCDTKDAGDIVAYKLNKEKLTEWLKKKVERVSNTALKMDLQFGSSTSSALNEEKKKTEQAPTQGHIAYAIDLIGEYLTIEMVEQLRKSFSLKQEQIVQEKEKKILSEKPKDDYFNKSFAPPAKKTKQSRQHMKLANSDKTGMKGLKSFFGSK